MLCQLFRYINKYPKKDKNIYICHSAFMSIDLTLLYLSFCFYVNDNYDDTSRMSPGFLLHACQVFGLFTAFDDS